MAFNLDSIKRGSITRPPRIILLGVEKIGKSEFAAGSDKPIFIPVKGEEGIDALDVDRFDTVERYDDILLALGSLYSKDHNYLNVVIDSSSALDPLIQRAVCIKENVENIDKIGYQSGYNMSVDYWRKITEALDYLRRDKNMASIIIGHVHVTTFNDPSGPSYDHYEFDVHKKVRNMLFKWADCILFMNTKPSVEITESFGQKKGKAKDFTDGARYLYTQKRPSHPGGGRGAFGRLPYEIKLPNTQIKGSDSSWSVFKKAVSVIINPN